MSDLPEIVNVPSKGNVIWTNGGVQVTVQFEGRYLVIPLGDDQDVAHELASLVHLIRYYGLPRWKKVLIKLGLYRGDPRRHLKEAAQR